MRHCWKGKRLVNSRMCLEQVEISATHLSFERLSFASTSMNREEGEYPFVPGLFFVSSSETIQRLFFKNNSLRGQ